LRLHLARPAPRREAHQARAPLGSRGADEDLSGDARRQSQAAPEHRVRPEARRASRRRVAGSRRRPEVLEVPVRGAVKTVLMVCHANTARSVMAQVLLERMLARHGVDGAIRVRSGGIANYARDGMIASLDARLALREEGIQLGENDFVSTDLRRHRDLLVGADLILTMTVLQKQMLTAFDEVRDRPVFTLREFVGEEGDIDDPATQGEDVFRACRDEIKRCLEKSVPRLLMLLPG